MKKVLLFAGIIAMSSFFLFISETRAKKQNNEPDQNQYQDDILDRTSKNTLLYKYCTDEIISGINDCMNSHPIFLDMGDCHKMEDFEEMKKCYKNIERTFSPNCIGSYQCGYFALQVSECIKNPVFEAYSRDKYQDCEEIIKEKMKLKDDDFLPDGKMSPDLDMYY